MGVVDQFKTKEPLAIKLVSSCACRDLADQTLRSVALRMRVTGQTFDRGLKNQDGGWQDGERSVEEVCG